MKLWERNGSEGTRTERTKQKEGAKVMKKALLCRKEAVHAGMKAEHEKSTKAGWQGSEGSMPGDGA